MKIAFRDNAAVMIPENENEKRQMEKWLQANENVVFTAERKKGGAVSFQTIGNYEDACNVPINVVYDSVDETIRLLSNLAHTPFELEGKYYASVEAFWQGLKFSDINKREEVAKLHGKEALKAGKEGGNGEFFTYQDRKIRTGSPEHWQLMKQACIAKFTQNKEACDALLSTRNRPLIHRTRKESKTIPNAVMADIWMKVRGILRKY